MNLTNLLCFAYLRGSISSTGGSCNTSNCDWEWGNDTKQTSKVSKKSTKEKKEESLISFETDNKAQNWNSKLEDDAWEILNN